VHIKLWFSQDFGSVSRIGLVFRIGLFRFSKDQDLGVQFFYFLRIWIWFLFKGLVCFAPQQYKDAKLSGLLITYSAEGQKASIFGHF
jgi:hypothetical protein